MSDDSHVGRAALLLGFAGLLPAGAATSFIVAGRLEAMIVALLYPAIILSFLGGMWWGFAMRRTERQGQLAFIAVLPSLVAITSLLVSIVGSLSSQNPEASGAWPAWAGAVMGTAILLTLLVDRHLVRTGETPSGWMRLRVPLSVGLGGLTIVSSALFGRELGAL